jgi:histidinol-phosphate/aromatic aminotransferase/cobyric acid decarboxylase-like protein
VACRAQARFRGKIRSAQQIVQRLKDHTIYLRNADSMSAHFADKFLRIAVKKRSQQQRIVAALKDYTDSDAEI